jgi:2-amino-4-hydroxy-6-hydroxymethyldihydropteridine diphosphokinase
MASMRKGVAERLTLLRSKNFPRVCKHKSRYRYKVVVGIGGNIADVMRRFEHLFVKLLRDRGVEILRSGLILKNPPFGYTNQNDFYNSVLLVATSKEPKVFLRYLLHVEKHFGRKRSFKDAPRTLDLDILFFENRVIDTKQLRIPHPHWRERLSVLIPLASLYR